MIASCVKDEDMIQHTVHSSGKTNLILLVSIPGLINSQIIRVFPAC